MNLLTVLIMALGVVVSVTAGLVCYVGDACAASGIACVPGAEMILQYPQCSLGLGGVMVVLGVLLQPTHV